ncbi:MAG: hypothetical protein PHU21_02390 [Elusimicrobia bacterium]|nr:hypothetical protein [Elusimicrobiota bacterium]
MDKNQRLRLILWRVFCRPFTAPSLPLFWRYWNPFYGYYLGKYVYRPCRRMLPHPISVLATFAFCGFFLHDILGWPAYASLKGGIAPPHNITTWFLIIALGLVVSEKLGLRFDSLAPRARAGIHLAYLCGTYLLMRLVV